MKITQNDVADVLIKDLKVGDCFLYCNDVFLCVSTDDSNDFAVVNLTADRLIKSVKNILGVPVILVDAEVTYR